MTFGCRYLLTPWNKNSGICRMSLWHMTAKFTSIVWGLRGLGDVLEMFSDFVGSRRSSHTSAERVAGTTTFER
jgi:hypothetical protein